MIQSTRAIRPFPARPIVLALGILAGIAGQVVLTNQRALIPGAALLAFGALCVGLGAGSFAQRAEAPSRFGIGTLVGVLALFGGALAVRLYANTTYPPSLFYDEAVNGLVALRITSLPGFQLWDDALSGRPTLHLYLLNGAFRVFGVSVETLRGVSAVGGALSVVFTFLAVRELASRQTAGIAAILVLVSRWDMSYSRIAFEAIWGVAFATATLWLLIGGVRRRSALWLTLAAVPFALGFYTYVAYRLFAVAIAVFWLHLLVRERLAVWRGAVGFGVIGLAIAAPLIQFAWQQPARFTYRFQQVSIFRDVQAQGSWQPLVETVVRHLQMFNDRGPDGWFGFEPLLGVPFAISFVLGLGIVLRSADRPEFGLLLTTLLTALAAGALTIVVETPHPTRALIAAPITAVCAGLFLGRVAEAVPARLVAVRVGQLALIALLLAAIARDEWQTLVRLSSSPHAYNNFQSFHALVAASLRGRIGQHEVFGSEVLIGFPTDAQIEFLNYPHSVRDIQRYYPWEAIPAPSGDRPVSYLLTLADAVGAIPALQQLYPTGVATTHRSPFGEPIFVTFDVPAAARREARGLRARYLGGGGPVERVDSAIDLTPAQLPVAAPFSVEWRGTLVTRDWGAFRFRLAGAAESEIRIDGVAVGEATPAHLAIGAHRLAITARVVEAQGVQLLWAKGDGPFQPVPADAFLRLDPPGHGLEVAYYGDGPAPHLIALAPALAINPPATRANRAVWRGEVHVPTTGRYVIRFGADDHGAVLLDGRVLISNEGKPPATTEMIEVNLTAGWHPIEVRWINRDGAYALGLSWALVGQPIQPVPGTSFRPIQGPYQ